MLCSYTNATETAHAVCKGQASAFHIMKISSEHCKMVYTILTYLSFYNEPQFSTKYLVPECLIPAVKIAPWRPAIIRKTGKTEGTTYIGSTSASSWGREPRRLGYVCSTAHVRLSHTDAQGDRYIPDQRHPFKPGTMVNKPLVAEQVHLQKWGGTLLSWWYNNLYDVGYT